MDKENNLSTTLLKYIFLALLISVVVFIQLISEFSIRLEYQILISLAIGVILSIVTYLLKKFNIIKTKTNEEKEQEKQEEQEKKEKMGKKEKIGKEFRYLLSSSAIIIMLMFFYLGAIPGYFGVNDELINPTEYNQSFNYTAEVVKDTLISVTHTLHNVGVENPAVWFWMWWVAVAYLMVYPIGKIIYYIFKPNKGEETKEEDYENI